MIMSMIHQLGIYSNSTNLLELPVELDRDLDLLLGGDLECPLFLEGDLDFLFSLFLSGEVVAL